MNTNEKTHETLNEKMRVSIKNLIHELVDRNIANIATEMLDSSESSVGFTLKIDAALCGHSVAVIGKIAWARKFSDKEESTFRLSKSDEPEIPGLTVEIGSGEEVVTFTSAALGQVKEVAKKLKGKDTE